MKVFISWSGETSRNIAEILRQWIPSVIQAVKPYYSPDDIAKGARWSNEISRELDDSRVGIICLTKDNLNSPWIMFEAGALSKNIDKSKVCPLLFGIEPSDIQGPLLQFQAAKFSKEEMKLFVSTLNSELGETALSNGVLDNVFEMWWPKLEEKIQAEMAVVAVGKRENVRTERSLLEEILLLTRTITNDVQTPTKTIESNPVSSNVPKGLAEEIYTSAISLAGMMVTSFDFHTIRKQFEKIFQLLDVLAQYVHLTSGLKRRLRYKADRFLNEMSTNDLRISRNS